MAQGQAADIMRLNLHSRLASRVLLQLAQGAYRDEATLYALARQVRWQDWLSPKQTLRVDLSAQRSPLKSLQFATLKVKDAICDALRDAAGARPSIDTQRPDVRVFAHLSQHEAWLYLDTSGEPLFKRGWRQDKGEAPIKENLAAGLVQLCGWDGRSALMDPFCGSGTLLIEAAQWAMARAPGLDRRFAFEALPGFDAALLRRLREQARAAVVPLEAPIVGSDAAARMLGIARRNAQRAGVPQLRFERADAAQLQPAAAGGWLLTNPPYGERLAADDTLFNQFGTVLKQRFQGWQAWIISADLALPKQLGLQPKRKIPLFNGPLETRLFGFELVGGSYRPRAAAATPQA
jgi:putative N6-adenine-specific DNA methylase